MDWGVAGGAAGGGDGVFGSATGGIPFPNNRVYSPGPRCEGLGRPASAPKGSAVNASSFFATPGTELGRNSLVNSPGPGFGGGGAGCEVLAGGGAGSGFADPEVVENCGLANFRVNSPGSCLPGSDLEDGPNFADCDVDCPGGGVAGFGCTG